MYIGCSKVSANLTDAHEKHQRNPMNLITLFNHMHQDPNWIRDNTTLMLVNDLVILDNGGQVRQGGINSSHASELENDILTRGQKVPITVAKKPFPPEHEHAGKYAVYEGNHRLTAFLSLKDRCGNDDRRFDAIQVYQASFKSTAEKDNYQLSCNEHHPSRSSTNEDYALVLRKRLKTSKGVDGITWSNFSDKEENFGLVSEWCKKTWRANGNRIKSIIKKALDGNPSAKLRNYTKNSMLEYFKNNNNIGWAGKKAGEECNNHAVYTISASTHVFPNLTGNSFRVKTDNSKTQTVAVCWDTNTLGKTAKGVKDFRTTTISNINKANASALLDRNATLIDKLVFAPQMKTEKSLIWAQKDSNGQFQIV